ncbi:MAG: hypothetical protein KC435_08735 [Thermomicrobiales bacterium]|nr:hypothetical protein [Thermomicrobiales bacterium]
MSIILIILMIMFSGFMVSSSEESTAVAIDRPVAISVVDTTVDDDQIFVFEVLGLYEDAGTVVSLSFANISGTDLQSVEITVGCHDDSGNQLDTQTLTYDDVVDGSMVFDRDIVFPNNTCAEITAEVTNVTP